MRKSCMLIILLMLMLTFTACSKNVSEKQSEIDGPASLAEYLTSFDDLTDRASIIVEVSIVDNAKTIEFGGVVFTISNANVLSSLKGAVNPGSEIKIIETGGMMSDGQEFKFNGIPVAKKGENLFLFLDKYEGPIAQDVFVPIGVYQGKFKVKDDKVIQQTPTDEKLKDYKPITKAEFKEKVKAKTKKTD